MWVPDRNAQEDNPPPNRLERSRRVPMYTDAEKLSMSKAILAEVEAESVDDALISVELHSKEITWGVDGSVQMGVFGAFSLGEPLPLDAPREPESRSNEEDQRSSKEKSSQRQRYPSPPAALTDTVLGMSDGADISYPVDEADQQYAQARFARVDILPEVGGLLDWPDLFDLDSPFYYLSSPGFDDSLNLSASPRLPFPLSFSTPDLDGNSYSYVDPNQGTRTEPIQINDEELPDPPQPQIPSIRYLDREDAQLLLRHLKDDCIPHMWSAPLGSRSPLDIHLDAAMMTLAKITYMGRQDISHASLANLLALLAISSKHLAAQTVTTQPETSKSWDEFAEQNLAEAREKLKYSLQNEISPKLAKYKDQVMAISMMLAFAILFDRQKEVRAYMDDMEKLLRTCGLAKRRISRKARLLHHTYAWNRIVGESTFVLRKPEGRAAQGHSSQPTRDNSSGPNDGGPTMQSPNLNDFLHLESLSWSHSNPKEREALHHIHLEQSEGKSESTFMLLYGISEEWLSLLSQTTRLANAMETVNAGSERPDVASLGALEKRKQRLENKVCAFAASMATNPDSSPRAHLVRALNSALVIFFYRRVRNVNPWILQQHVNSVIQALKGFDVSCVRESIAGPGSPWPAFMAGCEAMTPEQRDYLSGWIDHAFSRTGFSRLVTAKSCMEEVWRRQDRIGQDRGENMDQDWTWADISKEQDLYILLS